MDSRAFEPFGLSHGLALAATATVGVALVRFMRSPLVPERRKRRARIGFAMALLLAVASDPVLNWLRYAGEDRVLATTQVLETALPLYLCDVVSILLALALLTRNQRLAEIGYLWGLAGTVQGLVTPTLYFDWDAPEYYAFFIQHGGAPVAALTLVLGMGIVPEKGAFLRAVYWSWGYIVVVFAINGLLNIAFKGIGLEANYGFLNAKPEVGTLFDSMGPWPYYLLTLQVIAFSFYALLLLPFRREFKR